MKKRTAFIIFSILMLTLPISALAANVPAKVYENGANDLPIAQSGVQVAVFGGPGFKALLSSTESAADGGCLLGNIPLGKDVLVRLTKLGYISQYDIRSYSDNDVQQGVVFWIGSEARVKGLYSNLGVTFNATKGQVYLEIDDENTGEGIEGIQFAASSGDFFDLGRGEYLIANAVLPTLKITFQKPGYAFDIESATIPLFLGGMTQYYIKVQSGGAVYASPQAAKVTSATISGVITTLSGATTVPLSGVSVAFTYGGTTVAPTVTTDATGHYSQKVRLGLVRVTPTKSPFTFKPNYRRPSLGPAGLTGQDFKGTK